MGFQAVPNVAEANMIFSLGGVTVQNVHYALALGGYDQASLQVLANTVDNIFDPNFRDNITAEVEYVRTEVRGLGSENDLTAEADAEAGPGIHTGDSLPNNVTFAIKKTSGFTGRSARGRTFWIGVPEVVVLGANDNFVSTAWGAAVVDAIDLIRTAIDATADWEAVLVSRFTGGVKRDEGETFPWTGTSHVNLRVDTHRSRLPAS